MALAAGRRLGPYQILSLLGVGGMGEVYKARDTRLDRVVAIKVLPEAVAADKERLRRFAHEARAASALNHPSIVAVYDVGTEDSVTYIAMEHVDGRTLSDVLQRSAPMAVKRMLDVAVAVAEGLASAHEAGLIHRDVKPGNVMIANEGFVKIVDFGLAKHTVAADGVSSDATTDSAPGGMLGTISYMSPEQASRSPVDFRSDQFSFGAVLYEMASGRRAFRGDTEVDTLAAILHLEPEPISRLNPAVPAPLRWIIERCLAKAPGDRYDSTRDLARDLRGLRDHLGEALAGAPEPARRKSPGRGLVLLMLVSLAVAAAGLWRGLPGTDPAPHPDFRRLTLREGAVYRALFVPNSNAILYTASWKGQPVRSYLTLPESKGADRSLEADTQLPMAYTEDGSEVLVLLGRSRPAINAFGRLAWWPALGGKPRPLLDEAGWSDWARKSHFLVTVRQDASERRLDLLDAKGRAQRTLFRTTGAISYVRISPDERHVAFFHHPSRSDEAAEVQIVAVDGSLSKAASPRYERCVGLAWSPGRGEVWFTATRGNILRTTLWSTGLSREPRVVYSLPDFFALQDVSLDGSLFVSTSAGIELLVRAGDGGMRDHTWLGSTMVSDIAPDGRSLLFLDGATTEPSFGTWVRPLDGADAVRIADGDPGKFSPDGRFVVTTSRPVFGPPQLALAAAAGGDVRQLTSSPASHSDPSFAGSDTILFVRSEGGRSEVWRIGTDGSGARSLGAPGCIAPAAQPAGQSFLCLEGTTMAALFLHPTAGGGGRKLYELAPGERFIYARWDETGKRIRAVTTGRRFLTLDPGKGLLLREEAVVLPEGYGAESLRAIALSPDARIQAYSVSRFSSRLYYSRGL